MGQQYSKFGFLHTRCNWNFAFFQFHRNLIRHTNKFSFLSWPNTLLTFAASFYLTWLAFAILYYIICWHHGDLDPEFIKKELERQMNQTGKEASWIPCVLELEDFASAFLFSLVSSLIIFIRKEMTTSDKFLLTFMEA